jgi:hypothetical protein
VKALKKLKQKPPAFKQLSFLKCASIAEFYHQLSRLDAQNNKIYVIVVENLNINSVVPCEPEYVESVSDDEEAPISIGAEESRDMKRNKWILNRPHRVEVLVETTDVDKKGQVTRVPIACYADTVSAVLEAFDRCKGVFSSNGVWVEGAPTRLFERNSKLNLLAKENIGHRLLSNELRNTFLWAGICELLPNIESFFLNSEVSDTQSTKSVISSHLQALFPRRNSISTMIIIGGSARADKFMVMDQLIDLVKA